jgi:diadenylate cyclase
LAWLVYQAYDRFKGTQAERILRGLIMLLPVMMLCYILKLSILTKIFEIFSQTFIVGLIVIFAPEFRRVLIQLGGEFNLLNYIDGHKSLDQLEKANKNIVASLEMLQKRRVGALIIVEKSQAERYYINAGFPINADISTELMMTIFDNKSPLHDGAVIIRGTQLALASVILPMTENPKLDWQYGTRHRAAIGFSEVTDALCFVVSEETGDISMAKQGKLKRYETLAALEQELSDFYKHIYHNRSKRTQIFSTLGKVLRKRKKIIASDDGV